MSKLATILFTLILASHANAQTDPHALVSALESELKGNVLMLRGFLIDNDLKFDADCNPEKTYHSRSWTEAEFNVENIEVKGSNIVMTGHRSGFARDDKSGLLVKVAIPENNGLAESRKMKITIKGPFQGASGEFVEKVKKRIFIMDFKELKQVAPPWWRPYLNGEVITKTKDKKPIYVLKEYGEPSDEPKTTEVQPVGHLSNGEPLYRVGKGTVSAPKPIKTPDPEYTDVARAARFQGISILSATILQTGEIGEVKIVRPLGLGLDDQAVAIVRTWKFNPAMKDGVPVSVLVNIEVSFNLY